MTTPTQEQTMAARREAARARHEAEGKVKLLAMLESFPQDPATAHRMSLGTNSGSTIRIDCPGREHCSLWTRPEPDTGQDEGWCGLIDMVENIGTELLEYQIGPAWFPASQPFPIGFTWTNQGAEEWPEVDWWPLPDAVQPEDNYTALEAETAGRKAALAIVRLAREQGGIANFQFLLERADDSRPGIGFAIGMGWLTTRGMATAEGCRVLDAWDADDKARTTEAEYNTVYNALRDNWEGEKTPGEAVDIIFDALRPMGMWSLRLTEHLHGEAVKVASMVFADLGPTVDYGALTANVLRVLRGEK
jgi:hypothetical protein